VLSTQTRPLSLEKYASRLAASGRNCFTTAEVHSVLGSSLVAVRAALRRLKRKGEIADPYRGFHVIVPPEYRSLGCLPPEQFIPQLMAHLNEPYYVTLLSAAEVHGAAHQPPQALQVMVAKNRRQIVCGKVRVCFVARRDLAATPTVQRNTPRGTMRVSSVEATALELVGYADQCGGLDNVASVLAELVDAMAEAKLLEAASLAPIAWAQRLGYLLDLGQQPQLADPLAEHVRRRARAVVPLVRSRSITRAPRAERWRLAINARLEPDA
jgi:predicted transcriptional regulator of viral defense system